MIVRYLTQHLANDGVEYMLRLVFVTLKLSISVIKNRIL